MNGDECYLGKIPTKGAPETARAGVEEPEQNLKRPADSAAGCGCPRHVIGQRAENIRKQSPEDFKKD